MPSLESHRRSLSEGCTLDRLYLAALAEKTAQEEPELPTLPESVDDHHPLVLAVRQAGESLAALAQRSKSESFICTAQGIVIQDTKSQQYPARLERLVALAADASGSQSNVLLAKKALRYRKVLERRRVSE